MVQKKEPALKSLATMSTGLVILARGYNPIIEEVEHRVQLSRL